MRRPSSSMAASFIHGLPRPRPPPPARGSPAPRWEEAAEGPLLAEKREEESLDARSRERGGDAAGEEWKEETAVLFSPSSWLGDCT
uniref:Uncharacterized protein n=1 Tax=Arundo donax TaxID=35708 RepID=A0A0A9E6M2_ARUDO